MGRHAGPRDDSHPGRNGADILRFYPSPQNGGQFKTYELLISGIFHLVFYNHCWQWGTETIARETEVKRGLLYTFPYVTSWFLSSSDSILIQLGELSLFHAYAFI